MHPNAALIARFYTAFQARDAATMGACYAPDVVFSDPAFGELRGDEARGMWEMLVGRATGLVVEFSAVEADDTRGSAHWEARYDFTQTGRKVHNVIDAAFEFRDGLIVRHQDTFDFWAWSRQALGPTGVLLGWSGFLQGKVRAQARKGLERHLSGARG